MFVYNFYMLKKRWMHGEATFKIVIAVTITRYT